MVSYSEGMESTTAIEVTAGGVTLIWNWDRPECTADEDGWMQCRCFDCQEDGMNGV